MIFKNNSLEIANNYDYLILDIWDDLGTHTDKLLKSSLVNFLCRLQNSDCLTKSSELFAKIDQTYFSNPNQVEIKYSFIG